MRIKKPIILFLVLVCICLLAYPFFFPVILSKNVSFKNRDQIYFRAKEISFTTNFGLIRRGAMGELLIKEAVVLEKFKLKEIKGPLHLFWKGLTLKPLSADFINGTIDGSAGIDFHKGISYTATLNIKNIAFQKIIEGFKITDRVDLTGLGSGAVMIVGEMGKLRDLKGDIEATHEGGTLIITDQKWLQEIATYTKQDINVIVENFKNYHYNKGIFNMRLKDSNLIVEMHLNGENGKRDLIVTLHDFNHF
jgi:hypothetical protein